MGTGSLRGMPLLTRLRDADFAIWPFDDAAPAVAVEIYPRIFTGAVVKSDEAARRRFLANDGRVPKELVDEVASEEDPFDAAISALVMAQHVDELLGLKAQPEYTLEGAIWRPGWHPGRAYLDPDLPDGPFVFDCPNGYGEGPFEPEHAEVRPDGSVRVQGEIGTPRFLRVIGKKRGWLLSEDGEGTIHRIRVRAYSEVEPTRR